MMSKKFQTVKSYNSLQYKGQQIHLASSVRDIVHFLTDKAVMVMNFLFLSNFIFQSGKLFISAREFVSFPQNLFYLIGTLSKFHQNSFQYSIFPDFLNSV